MAENPEPLVIIVSGPSGSGKSTLVEKILELPGTMLSVSCTTRPPRRTESEGKWYNFITEEQFRQMAANGEFLEYAQVYGKHWYGTPWKRYLESRSKGLDLVLEIDVQGAQQVQQTLRQKATAIFIVPPSKPELEKRLFLRGQDTEEAVARRLERARMEITAFSEYYNYCIINDDLERAAREVQAIVVGVRCQVDRNRERVREILKSFGG